MLHEKLGNPFELDKKAFGDDYPGLRYVEIECVGYIPFGARMQ